MTNLIFFLNCPYCQIQLEINKNKLKCNRCEYYLIRNNNIWTTKNILENKYKHWQDSDGTRLRERAKARFSTSKFESIYYNKIIQDSLKLLKKNSVILELGAGDGRFTDLFKTNNFVIVNDINFQSLLRFSNLSNNDDRLLFICCSYEKLPIKKNSIDMIAAIECLYYSNKNFEKILEYLLKILNTNGLFLDSEPLIDGVAIYNLINMNFRDVLSNLDKNLKQEIIDKFPFSARVFSIAELNKIYKRNSLEIIIEKNIPLFYSILSLIMTEMKDSEKSLIFSKIANSYQEENSDSGRCRATLLKK